MHWLTKERDREKTVFELHKAIGEAAAATKTIAIDAWSEIDRAKRAVAIGQTKWKLQQLGGLVERLRKVSERRRWRKWRGIINKLQMVGITITQDMADLRDAITEDPFEDPDREGSEGQAENVEQAIGGFLQALDEALLGWMD